MKGITIRQASILCFVKEFMDRNQYAPTIREIAAYFEISAKGAQDHITALRRKGFIKSAGSKPRTMVILKEVYLAP